MLAAIIFLTNRAGTSNYSAVLEAINSGKLALSATEELWLFLAFFVAFAIKLALFPLHTWLAFFLHRGAGCSHHDAGRRDGQNGHLQHHALLSCRSFPQPRDAVPPSLSSSPSSALFMAR